LILPLESRLVPKRGEPAPQAGEAQRQLAPPLVAVCEMCAHGRSNLFEMNSARRRRRLS
jgi:hypothetical protein